MNDCLSTSRPAELDLSGIREVGIICHSCGEESRVRVSEPTLQGVPQVCPGPGCQAGFADERQWLIASLEGLGEAVKYSGLLLKTRVVLRSNDVTRF